MNDRNDPDGQPSREEDRRRRRLIDQSLAQLGKTWATGWVADLLRANRNIEGGWPGRLAEARALVQRELPKQLAAQGLAPPSAGELASAPSTLNEHARAEWLQNGKSRVK